jgi:hypothetical protein
MSYLEKLEADLSIEGYELALRAITNWCNGNLIAVTKQRLANIEAHDNPDGLPVDEDVSQAMPNEPAMPPTKRGSIFASIREACFKVAEEKGLEGYSKPRTFSEYIDSRMTQLRSSVPDEVAIRTEMNSIGTTYDEARRFLMESYKIQAAELEKSRDDLVAEDTSYDSDIDFDEALDSLPAHQQHRLRVKLIDSFLYECERLQKQRTRFPNFEDLRTKRELLMSDAIILEADMHKFEKENEQKLRKELLGSTRELIKPTRAHINTLQLAKRQIKERAEAEKTE